MSERVTVAPSEPLEQPSAYRARLLAHWSRVKAAAAAQSTFAGFAGSTLALNAASLIGGTLALRWVDPAGMGVWQTLLLAQSYFLAVRFGILNGMNRELPYLLGKDARDEALRLAGTAQFHAVVCSALALLGFGAALWACWGWGPDWRWALASMAVLASATFYLGYLQATFRSSSDFRRLAHLQWAQAGTTLLLPGFAAEWQFRGLCAHGALQCAVIVALAHRIRPLPVQMRWHWKSARLLLATGLPLFGSSYAHTIAAGLDRLILLRVAGVEALGYYAPAVAVVGAMSVLPSAVATYLYPKLSYRLGRGEAPEKLWRTAASATMVSALLVLPLVVVGWFLAPTIVPLLFPAYARSVPAMQMALITGLGLSMSGGLAVLGTLKAWKHLYAYSGLLLFLKLALPWYSATTGDAVVGVARGSMWATLLASAVGFSAIYHSTHAMSGRPVQRS